jgi:hypothetical protein
MSQANPQGPAPGKSPPATIVEYIGGLFRGTLSVIDAPSPADMAKHTKAAFACSPLREDEQPVVAPRDTTRFPPRWATRARSNIAYTSSRRTAPTIRFSAI